jgi:thiamine-monophosphate kinase
MVFCVEDIFNRITMNGLLENKFLVQLASNFQRSPQQLNQLIESDAELLKLNDDYILAVTTDCIVEEIDHGLYDDPYLIGWMVVVSNLSDVAAVGARPLGILLQQTLPSDYPAEQLTALQKGIHDACQLHQTFVLGGDTNFSKKMQMGATAIGCIEDKKLIQRNGCCEGDILYVSGKMGIGNAYAFNKIFSNASSVEISYLPDAKLTEGNLVRQFGSCCIDTSDGFFPALCNLMEINTKGFRLNSDFQTFLHPGAVTLSSASQIPPWFFLAGPHGEFELLFTIPSSKNNSFLEASRKIFWQPIPIGRVIENYELIAFSGDELISLDPFRIANLFWECNGDSEKYLKELFKQNEQW